MIYLYIGVPAFLFKSKHSNVPLIRITNREEIEQFVVMYGDIQQAQSIAVEDLSYLTYSTQSFLLKFLEETNLNVALLSRFDRILPTIVSRADRIYKQMPTVKRKNTPLDETFYHYEETKNKTEKYKIIAEENPKLWYLLNKYPHMNRKHVQFFK